MADNPLQELVNQYNRKSNELFALKKQIVELRGTKPPSCFGEDDCSTEILVRCPWSLDCGTDCDKGVTE